MIKFLLISSFFPLSKNDYSLCHHTLIADAGARYPAFCTSCRTDYNSILVEVFPADLETTPKTRRISADDVWDYRLSCTLYRSHHSGIVGKTWRSSELHWLLRSASRRAGSLIDRGRAPRRLPTPRCSFPQCTERPRLQRYIIR